MDVKVAVASGLANAKELLTKVKNGEETYHFIEIMGCPGGCVTGGGQPQQPASVMNTIDLKAARAKVLYNIDKDIRITSYNVCYTKLLRSYRHRRQCEPLFRYCIHSTKHLPSINP